MLLKAVLSLRRPSLLSGPSSPMWTRTVSFSPFLTNLSALAAHMPTTSLWPQVACSAPLPTAGWGKMDCAAGRWDGGRLAGLGDVGPHVPRKAKHISSHSHREVGSTCHRHVPFAFALDFEAMLRSVLQALGYAGLLYLVSLVTQGLATFWCLYFQSHQ